MSTSNRAGRRSGDLAIAAAAAGVATLVSLVALRAWRLNLDIPLRYAGDAMQALAYVQNMVETGWYLEGPRLNAPFGQELHDWPLGLEHLHLGILRLLVAVTGQVSASVTTFYLLTFPLTALTAFWAMRRLHVRGPVALLGATVFALLPMHFLRGTGHLFLAAYYTVPLGALLCVTTLNRRPILGIGRIGQRPRLQRALAIGAATAVALLVASGGSYYTAFTLVLLGAATVMAALRAKSWRAVKSSAAMIVLIVGFSALNSAPTILYQLEEGPNLDVPAREARETERHALRPMTLILPVVGHRFEPFAGLAERYEAFPTPGERGESLGLFGTVGLLGLIAVAIASLTGAPRRARRWARQRSLAALTMVALLMAVTGGGSTVVALLTTTQLRAWNRISVFIAFFAILAVCLVLSGLWRRARHRQVRVFAGILGLAILTVAALDQTSDRFIPAYTAVADEYSDDRSFVNAVEARLPPGAAVYQMPYRPYPESDPVGQALDYDPLRGYLHSRHLRWSYGGMKGREAGWQPYVHARTTQLALPVMAAAGFSAVWVDRGAYEDRGRAVESNLLAVGAGQPIISPDGRFAVYDIGEAVANVQRQFSQDQWSALQQATLSPIWLRWRDGVVRGSANEDRIVRGATGDVTLDLVNEQLDSRIVVVSFTLATATRSPSEVHVRWPDGTPETLLISSDPAVIRRSLELATGANRVHIATQAPEIAEFGERDVLRLRISDLWALDADLLRIAID